MADVTFAEQENVGLYPPSLKMRQRLQSAPEKPMKSPMISKTPMTPFPSGRKVLGTVNQKISTPGFNAQDKKLLKPQQDTKVERHLQSKLEEYPEIEQFIPYNPLEFEKYNIPEDFIPISHLALPGLACFPSPLLEDPLEKIDPLPVSPVKSECADHCLELDAFLQTLNELTVDLPPEPDC